MPHYYPIFVDLESRLCLVVGAGPVGGRKAAGLLNAGARVRLVSTEVSPVAAALSADSRVDLLFEPYKTEHLEAVSLVFAATDSRTVNAQVAADAAQRNIPVNIADSPDYNDPDIFSERSIEFIVPAILRRGDLCIAISTGGASPMLAQKIRSDLELVYGVDYSAYLELLTEMRSYIKERTDDSSRRSAAFAGLVEAAPALRVLLRDTGSSEARDEAHRIIEAALHSPLE